jgi:hypothetical protein
LARGGDFEITMSLGRIVRNVTSAINLPLSWQKGGKLQGINRYPVYEKRGLAKLPERSFSWSLQ